MQLPFQEMSLSLKRRHSAATEGYTVPTMFTFLLSPPTDHLHTFVNTFLLSYQLFTNGHELLGFLSEAHQKEVGMRTEHDVRKHSDETEIQMIINYAVLSQHS